MRIINLRVDGPLFEAMKEDKEARGFTSWETYINWLFQGRKTNG